MSKSRIFGKNFAPILIATLIIIGIAVALIIGGSEKPKSKTSSRSSQPSAVNTSCGPYRKDGVVTINGNQINVETAAGTSELTKGLSGRPCILSNWGMLFDFSRDGQYAIWMKDMKFPIDVAWISSINKKVVALEIDFKPSTYPERRVNQAPARYVLEMAANKSKELNLDIGTIVHFQKT